jgi:hypothetical protein
VLEEFGERLLVPMTDGDRARVGEIEAKENIGTVSPIRPRHRRCRRST